LAKSAALLALQPRLSRAEKTVTYALLVIIAVVASTFLASS